MRGRAADRRTVLRGGMLLGAGVWLGPALAACSLPGGQPGTPTPAPPPTAPQTGGTTRPSTGTRTLLAYFSRPGENYYYGGRRDLETGNTEVLAQMIKDLIDCDVHRIEAAEPYSASYDATVARNVREQESDARPAIAEPLASIEQYDTVLLASPIWNVRAPMIMTTFADGHDFADLTVHPVVTYAVSGLGRTERDYAAACPGARIGKGLAVRGEEVAKSRPAVEDWLREVDLRG